MYFPFFKLHSWGKRSAVRRRRFIQRLLKGKALQEAILSIRSRYGKNSILKGMNYEEAATGRERNLQIGGHRSGTG